MLPSGESCVVYKTGRGRSNFSDN